MTDQTKMPEEKIIKVIYERDGCPVCGYDGMWYRETWDELENVPRADLATAEVQGLVQALEKSESEYADLEDRAPVDAGCIECTAGTVPNKLNTGLCAHHMRIKALQKFRGREKPNDK